jgi:hypothetical protein
MATHELLGMSEEQTKEIARKSIETVLSRVSKLHENVMVEIRRENPVRANDAPANHENISPVAKGVRKIVFTKHRKLLGLKE